MKDTQGKLDLTTVPPEVIIAIAKVREFGIRKYVSRDSWRDVDVMDYYKALWRHLIEIQLGNDIDEESGLPHTYHIACNIAFIISLEE